MILGLLIVVGAFALGFRVGFYVSKNVPYTRSLGEEIARRAGIALVYVQVAIGIIIPPYGRRRRRKLRERNEAFMASLKPIERQPWWTHDG